MSFPRADTALSTLIAFGISCESCLSTDKRLAIDKYSQLGFVVLLKQWSSGGYWHAVSMACYFARFLNSGTAG